MKTDRELMEIVRSVRFFGHQGPHVIKLLRSIEISALREARELVEKHHTWDGESWNGENPALPDLETKIRTLELQ